MLKHPNLISITLQEYFRQNAQQFNLQVLAQNLYKRYLSNLIFLQLNRWVNEQREFNDSHALLTALQEYILKLLVAENTALQELSTASSLSLSDCQELAQHNLPIFFAQQVLSLDSDTYQNHAQFANWSYDDLKTSFIQLEQQQKSYLLATTCHNYYVTPKHHIISNLPQFFSFVDKRIYNNGMCFNNEELEQLEQLNNQWSISSKNLQNLLRNSDNQTNTSSTINIADYFLNLIYFCVDSTHLTAQRELEACFTLEISSNQQSGYLLYIALHQSNGQGTKNRQWFTSSFSDLAMTLVTPVTTAITSNLEFLPIKTTTAIHQVFNHHFPKRKLLIKWPNDVYGWDEISHNHAKLLGFLTNIEKKCLLVGIGANISAKVADFQLASSTTASQFVATCLTTQESLQTSWQSLLATIVTIADQISTQTIFNITSQLQMLNYYKKFNLYQIGDDVFRIDNNQHYKVADFSETGWISLLNDLGEIEKYSSASITLRKV